MSAPPIERYVFTDEGLDDEQFAIWLGELPPFPHMCRLHLNGNHLTSASIKAIEEASLDPMYLSLAHNSVGDEGARFLATAEKFSGIRVLYLRDTAVTHEGVGVLLGADTMLDWLWELDLSDNLLGDEGLQAIARGPKLESLSKLYLNNVGMTDAGAQALTESSSLGKLDYLSVVGNSLTELGVSVLNDAGNFAAECQVIFDDEGGDEASNESSTDQ